MRPSEFTQEIADNICEKIADGLSLREICKADELPNRSTVFRWLSSNESFRDQYARAREAQADTIFDEILDIADDGRNDWMLRIGADDQELGWKENGEALRRSQLRVDARKWMAGKLRPKKYGDKIEVDNNHNLADPMMQMLERISNTGNRLVDRMKLSPNDEPSPAGRNDIAPEGEK